MSFDIRTIPLFEKDAKVLAKRHRSFKTDFGKFLDSLREDPRQGVELSPGIRKVRMTITSKGRGKSGGARIITFTILTSNDDGKIYLIDIYDKADYSTVDVSKIKNILKELCLT